MRPRFSLKWLLLGFTLLAVSLYLVAIYPGVVAKRFATEINQNAVNQARCVELERLLLKGESVDEYRARAAPPPYRSLVVTETAVLQAPTFHDLIRLQRRVEVDLSLKAESDNFNHGLGQHREIAVSITGTKRIVYW
jgi:hypothetical protein